MSLSPKRILGWRGLELNFPLEDAGAGRGGFGLGDVACGLERDGERGVGERVCWREGGESQGRGDGLFQETGIAEGADEAMMGIEVCGIGGDGDAKGCGGFGGLAGGEEIDGALVFGLCKRFDGKVGFGHGCL